MKVDLKKNPISMTVKKKKKDFKIRKFTHLERVFVALELAKLSDNTIELVLAHRVTFFFPFPYCNDCTAFCVHQT